jgi:pantoate--beta-alanine ligase
MRIVPTIAEMRVARRDFAELGFVPTMGFLHAGHISLVERAKAECGAVAVSIFVNPTQFAPHEDFERYPRDMERDLAMLRAAGADLVFTPSPAEMYPPGAGTSIDVGAVARPLEGEVRPGHFGGVATVVAKLFNIVQPTRAYFGQKDAQQTVVIRQLVRDLDMPVEVVVAPTVREADGLAMSSRNSYLTPELRASATVLYRALQEAERRAAAGERDAEALRAAMRQVIATEPSAVVEYVSVADPDTLQELTQLRDGALASLAVRFGATRLIDNLALSAKGAERSAA